MKGGAQVNIITKRGGSEYHGTGYCVPAARGVQRDELLQQPRGPCQAGVPLLDPRRRPSAVPSPRFRRFTDGNKLFFFYSVDDTQLKDVNPLRRYTVPTALERAGDFSQTRTPAGALIVVRDPTDRLPFPGNKIPANRTDARRPTLLNMLPMPNVDGVGYNYVRRRKPSIDHPRRQHLTRVDYRPTDKDSLSFKYSSWYTKSVGRNVAGRSARWGLVRQRYDFTADQASSTTRASSIRRTILEFTAGIFYSTEDGPPEDDMRWRVFSAAVIRRWPTCRSSRRCTIRSA